MAGHILKFLSRRGLRSFCIYRQYFRSYSRSNIPIQPAIEKRVSLFRQKLSQLLTWYEEVTGMDEVRIAQNRVLEAEQKFISAQERRRQASSEVSNIQHKLKDLYAEIDSTNRGEERYVFLITQEHQLLKEERRLVDQFQHLEKEEREHFSVLSSAVKESHEKERAQAEKTKYWSIIGSIMGTVIGIVGSSINNELRMKELRHLVTNNSYHSGEPMPVKDILAKYERELSSLIEEIKSLVSSPNDQAENRLTELLHILSNKPSIEKIHNEEVISLVKEQYECIGRNINDLKLLLNSQKLKFDNSDNEMVLVPYSVEENLVNQVQILNSNQKLIIGTMFTVAAIQILLMMTK